jgi:MoaA/NifB/PqqE/SkfB family radical SAM enzyme
MINQGAYILRNYLLKRQKPFLASYKLTYRCNLRCRQCPFYSLEAADPTFEEACRTIDQLYLRGSRMLIFEGGEPMLWQDGSRGVSHLAA